MGETFAPSAEEAVDAIGKVGAEGVGDVECGANHWHDNRSGIGADAINDSERDDDAIFIGGGCIAVMRA